MTKKLDCEGVLRDFADKNGDFISHDEPFCFLNVFKPCGITSFDVVSKLRKRLKIRKIGHSGTLDPAASGVMQIGVGKTTRLLDYLNSDKKYVAKIRFGYFSSTADSEGDIVPFNIPNFTYDELLAALKSFIGQTEQIPPAYSAIKVDGKKLCDIARKRNGKITYSLSKNLKNNDETLTEKEFSSDFQGANFKSAKNTQNSSKNIDSALFEADSPRSNLDGTYNYSALKDASSYKQVDLDVFYKNFNENLVGVEIPKRIIQIYEANLLSFVTISNPDNTEQKVPYEAEIEIYCSKGTYIRSFAVDLAKKLGTCAYLTSLIRTKAGKFELKDSIQIDEIKLSKHAINPCLALDLPEYELNEEEYKKTLNGVSFVPRSFLPENKTVMLIFKNKLVSIGVLSDNIIVCKKVFK